MKKVLSFLLILSGAFMFAGCDDIPKITVHETDYFTYIEYSAICAVRRLTDEGKKLSALYIPAYLNGKPVTKVGENNLSSYYYLESDNIEYLNFPYTIKEFKGFTGVKKLKTLVICRVEPITIGEPIEFKFAKVPNIYVPNGYAAAYNKAQGPSLTYSDANISFMFNYEDAPNKGFYSVDYKESNETLTRPDDPIRENFIFGGWFEEESCSNQWDFSKPVESDKVLYALWTKK